MTGAVVPSPVANRLLNFYEHGEEQYNKFSYDRFVTKTVSLSATIKKVKLPNFASANTNNSTKKAVKSAEITVKDVSAAHKSYEIARGRGIPIAEILEYDLFRTNALFNGDFTTKPDKPSL